jgi:hypothetical protein
MLLEKTFLFRRSLHFSTTQEHRMGPYMSVCKSRLSSHCYNDLGSHCCHHYLVSLQLLPLLPLLPFFFSFGCPADVIGPGVAC